MRRLVLALLALGTAGNVFARGHAPQWLTAVAAAPAPKVPSDAQGVLLLDDTVTIVTESGEIRGTRRQAWRILASGGRDLGLVSLHSDAETRVTSMHGWTITAKGEELQSGDRDAVETSAASGELYNDQKIVGLRIPAAEPGNVIAVQYEYRGRPHALQDSWIIQHDVPAALVRYTLTLPAGWSHDEKWFNTAGVTPSLSGNALVWEMQNITAVKDEPHRAHDRAVAAQMSINFIPPQERLAGKAHRSWDDVAKWFTALAADRRGTTPAITAKARELTSGKSSAFERIAAIASFAQRDVRYVAIEVGIGGYQPHAAADVFTNRYGDCKDKVTVMSALLHEAGIESYYVLANTNRRTVDPLFATMSGFNHIVIAIPVADAPALPAVIDHPQLGKLLLFDPTSDTTPIGHVPEYLQNNELLVVTQNGGAIIHIAPSAADENSLRVSAKLALDNGGAMRGSVRETRTGAIAAAWRSSLRGKSEAERLRALNAHVGWHIAQFETQAFAIENLDDISRELVFRYTIVARDYAKPAGPLLLLRPRVLGEKAESIVDVSERTYDYETDGPSLQVDDIEITLPSTIAVDELPPPSKAEAAGFHYASATTVDGQLLRYHREYRVDRFTVPRAELPQVNRVFSAIMADERSSAVLKTR